MIKDQITLPDNYNYIGLFLTLRCNLKCSYCINLNEFGSERKGVVDKEISGDQWIYAINRIKTGREDLPVTLQGGEPTLHKDFYKIVNGINTGIKLDMLTNLMFDVDEFIENVPSAIFTRDAKYASIRASYHPGYNEINDLVDKIQRLDRAGIYVGLYSVVVPENKDLIDEAKEKCSKAGVDFRVKEYLGFDGEKWHGTYKYMDAIDQKTCKICECRTTELIVGSNGGVYRCHSDLYGKRQPVGSIIDPEFQISEEFVTCEHYGHCNPCDVKVTTNRFQEYGHTSVEIINVREIPDSNE